MAAFRRRSAESLCESSFGVPGRSRAFQPSFVAIEPKSLGGDIVTHARIELAFTVRETGVRPLDECAIALPPGVEPGPRGLEGRALHPAVEYERRAPYSKRAPQGCNLRPHLACASSSSSHRESNPSSILGKDKCCRNTLAASWSGHPDSNSAGTAWRADFSPREIPAVMAVATRSAEAAAFTTAGAGFGIRTRLQPIPRADASEDEPAWWTRGVTLPDVLVCKTRRQPFARAHGRSGRNRTDSRRIWNPRRNLCCLTYAV